METVSISLEKSRFIFAIAESPHPGIIALKTGAACKHPADIAAFF